uniref:Uncharacterized protein n=1 Tax=Anguilla anguilla TaxID=7936 RepID=A0A0E9WLV2_ANGAN
MTASPHGGGEGITGPSLCFALRSPTCFFLLVRLEHLGQNLSF